MVAVPAGSQAPVAPNPPGPLNRCMQVPRRRGHDAEIPAAKNKPRAGYALGVAGSLSHATRLF